MMVSLLIITHQLAQLSVDSTKFSKEGASAADPIPKVLRIVFQVATLLAVIFVALGGLKYTLANGDANAIKNAKNTLLYALIGLVITLSINVLFSFVVGRL